jgi:hypothetical protein
MSDNVSAVCDVRRQAHEPRTIVVLGELHPALRGQGAARPRSADRVLSGVVALLFRRRLCAPPRARPGRVRLGKPRKATPLERRIHPVQPRRHTVPTASMSAPGEGSGIPSSGGSGVGHWRLEGSAPCETTTRNPSLEGGSS